MQHLNEKWLKLINYYFIGCSALLLALYAVFVVQQGTLLVSGKEMFGISILSAGFALGLLLYNATLLRVIKKSNIWLAYVISLLLFAVVNNAAVEVAIKSSGSLVFMINNYIIIFAAVAFGPIVALFGVGIMGIIYAMTVSGTTTPTVLGVIGDGVSVVVRMVIIILLIYKLKDKYEVDSTHVNINYIERYFVNNEVVKLLTDSIGDGIIIVDNDGIIRSVNPGAAQIIHQNKEDVVDLNYKSVLKFKTSQNVDLTPEEDPVTVALSEKKPYSRELSLATSDNQQKFVDVNVSNIANPSSGELYGAVVILRDVSQKKREEAARSEFISTASHEMRTPVAAIEGYLALALNPNVGKIDDKARAFLEKAHESTQHLGRLFQDLLASSKAEDGRLVNRPSVVEIGGLLQQQADYYKIIADKKGITLELLIGSEKADSNKKEGLKVIKPLYYVHVDPDRIKEVISNLVDNAIKYTDSGKVEIGLTGNNEVVQIFIKDSGVGIPADDLPHLFQKFYRVDSSATRTTGGTGLGLFICKQIIELYKGNIWVESQKDVGSTFFVNIPRLNRSQVDSLNSSANVAMSIADQAINTQV